MLPLGPSLSGGLGPGQGRPPRCPPSLSARSFARPVHPVFSRPWRGQVVRGENMMIGSRETLTLRSTPATLSDRNPGRGRGGGWEVQTVASPPPRRASSSPPPAPETPGPRLPFHGRDSPGPGAWGVAARGGWEGPGRGAGNRPCADAEHRRDIRLRSCQGPAHSRLGSQVARGAFFSQRGRPQVVRGGDYDDPIPPPSTIPLHGLDSP